MIIADSERQLRDMMSKINETCKQYGMSMNVQKTKVMRISKKRHNRPLNITIDANKLKEVENTYILEVSYLAMVDA